MSRGSSKENVTKCLFPSKRDGTGGAKFALQTKRKTRWSTHSSCFYFFTVNLRDNELHTASTSTPTGKLSYTFVRCEKRQTSLSDTYFHIDFFTIRPEELPPGGYLKECRFEARSIFTYVKGKIGGSTETHHDLVQQLVDEGEVHLHRLLW